MLAAVLIAGCTSVQDMRDSQDVSGSMQTLNASLDNTFEITQSVLAFQGADILDADKAKKYIVAKQGISGGGMQLSYGEMIGVYFYPVDAFKTRVKLVQKNRVKFMMADAQSWDTEFFHLMAERINKRPPT